MRTAKARPDGPVAQAMRSAALGAGVWQPIETAPIAGGRVLLYREGWAECMGVGYWDRGRGAWQQAGGSPFPGPTHWQPLPPPPPPPVEVPAHD